MVVEHVTTVSNSNASCFELRWVLTIKRSLCIKLAESKNAGLVHRFYTRLATHQTYRAVIRLVEEYDPLFS